MVYEPNLLGHNGPRKINVIVPAMDLEGQRLDTGSASLTSLAKSKYVNIVSLFNKVPQWNDGTQF